MREGNTEGKLIGHVLDSLEKGAGALAEWHEISGPGSWVKPIRRYGPIL
jgi:hypothetical protein